jgi:hypothetical protein
MMLNSRGTFMTITINLVGGILLGSALALSAFDRLPAPVHFVVALVELLSVGALTTSVESMLFPGATGPTAVPIALAGLVVAVLLIDQGLTTDFGVADLVETNDSNHVRE